MSEKKYLKTYLKKLQINFNVVIWNAEDDSDKDSHLNVLNYLCHQEIPRMALIKQSSTLILVYQK